MRASIIGLTGLVFAATATPAFAQEETEESSSPISVSANVALTTDYRFRGVGFSNGNIAIQGGLDVNHDSGFYAGVWASSLSDNNAVTGGFGGSEVDVYGGWSGELTDGISADVGLLYFIFPDAPTGLNTDFFEPYASISADIGPASVTVGGNYAWSGQSALAGDNIYVYGDVSVGIPNTPVTLNGHVGYTDGSLAFGPDGDYTDFSIGADYAITDQLTASLAYVTTETDLNSTIVGPGFEGSLDDAVVFTVSASF